MKNRATLIAILLILAIAAVVSITIMKDRMQSKQNTPGWDASLPETVSVNPTKVEETAVLPKLTTTPKVASAKVVSIPSYPVQATKQHSPKASSRKKFASAPILSILPAKPTVAKPIEAMVNIPSNTPKVESTEPVQANKEIGAKEKGEDDLSINLNLETEVRYFVKNKNANIDLKLGFENKYGKLKIGASDRSGSMTLAHVYQEMPVNKTIRARVGFMYQKLGAGVEYTVNPNTRITLDVYDPAKAQVEIQGKLTVFQNIDLVLGINSGLNKTNAQDYSLGFCLNPSK